MEPTLSSILGSEGSELEFFALCFLWDSKRNYLSYVSVLLFSLVKWGLIFSMLYYCVAVVRVTI